MAPADRPGPPRSGSYNGLGGSRQFYGNALSLLLEELTLVLAA